MGFVVKECTCAECNEIFIHGKKLTEHFKKCHGLSSEEYAIKYVHNGIKPLCLGCKKETRFVSATIGFKRYCIDCSKLAEQEAGRTGGKNKKTWNKGKTKNNDVRIANLAIKMSGSNNSFYGKHHTIETITKISLTKTLSSSDIVSRIEKRKSEFELVTSLEEYVSRQQQYLEFKCMICGTIQPKTLQTFERGSRCYKCFPVSKSNWELDVFSFVQSLCSDTVSGDRTILAPKELDIYVPSKLLGIECHGLYWHSDGSVKESFNKRLHLEKYNLALQNSVQLLQLFQDEWRDKRVICESLIRHRLGMSLKRIGARKLKIKMLDNKSRKQFFDMSHIAGDVASTNSWGLVDDNDVIIAALSVRKPRQVKKYPNTLEVARFCTAPFINVPGCLSRLMNEASLYARKIGVTRLMTYVDRRIGNGRGYEQCGFLRTGSTGVDYFYTDNFLRYDRFKFRARGELSESEVAMKANVSRIYGCGSHIYEKSLL